MVDINWGLNILVVAAGLIVFTGMGIFIGTRIGSGRRRVRELEKELSETRKEMEAYRSQVNTHFKKTSELFTQMTNSYKAVYVHLAEGSQKLCSTDAARLKPANVEFLKVTHEEPEPAVEKPPAEHAGNDIDKKDDSPAAASGTMPQQEEVEEPDRPGTGPADIPRQEGKDEPELQEPGEEENREEESEATADIPPAAEEKKET